MGKTEKKVKCSPTGGSVADSPRALNIFDAAGFDAADKTHSCFSSHNVVRILSCHFTHRDIDCLKEQASVFFYHRRSLHRHLGWLDSSDPTGCNVHLPPPGLCQSCGHSGRRTLGSRHHHHGYHRSYCRQPLPPVCAGPSIAVHAVGCASYGFHHRARR